MAGISTEAARDPVVPKISTGVSESVFEPAHSEPPPPTWELESPRVADAKEIPFSGGVPGSNFPDAAGTAKPKKGIWTRAYRKVVKTITAPEKDSTGKRMPLSASLSRRLTGGMSFSSAASSSKRFKGTPAELNGSQDIASDANMTQSMILPPPASDIPCSPLNLTASAPLPTNATAHSGAFGAAPLDALSNASPSAGATAESTSISAPLVNDEPPPQLQAPGLLAATASVPAPLDAIVEDTKQDDTATPTPEPALVDADSQPNSKLQVLSEGDGATKALPAMSTNSVDGVQPLEDDAKETVAADVHAKATPPALSEAPAVEGEHKIANEIVRPPIGSTARAAPAAESKGEHKNGAIRIATRLSKLAAVTGLIYGIAKVVAGKIK